MQTLREAFERIEQPSTWERIGSVTLETRPWTVEAAEIARARAGLLGEGWLRMDGVLSPDEAARMADCVPGLKAWASAALALAARARPAV